jgi:hypothetical protein
MGLAPNSTIEQTNADGFDLSSNQRVSWHLDDKNNGYRLGSLIKLTMPHYYKVILKKDI